MSIQLEYCKVTPATLAKILLDESILGSIVFGKGEPPAEFDGTKDWTAVDYRIYSAIAEETGGMEISAQKTWTAKAAGVNFGSDLEFEFNYGPAFYFSVEEVKQIAEGLIEEGWNPEEDYDGNISRFFSRTSAEGKAVIGGVN